MNRKRGRDLAIIFFVGLFLLTKEMVFIWLMAFTVVALSSSYTKPSKHGRRRKKYLQDAEEKNIKIPSSHSIHDRLAKVYQKLTDSKKRQPELAESFDELVEDLWDNLALEDRMNDWRDLLDDVLAQWPERRQEVRQNLENKIRKVQKLSDQWSEARAEVYGKG